MQSRKKISSLSVFFPCFNEEKNIPLFVEEAQKVLPSIADKFEIIIINDGSTDGTGTVADNIVKENKSSSSKNGICKVIHHKKNRGYGAALRSGFEAASYEWVFFTDGDLQFELAQISQFIEHTDKYKAIIGFRKKRAEGSFRAFNAKLFKIYVDVLFRLHVRDVDCAFKLFRSDLIKSLDLSSEGAFISAEFLYRMKKKNIEFKQIPVDHKLRMHGSPTGNNINVVIRAGFEALKLYFMMKFGKTKNNHAK